MLDLQSLNNKLNESHLLKQCGYWFISTFFLLLEVRLLNGFFLAWLCGRFLPASLIYIVEFALLCIAFINALYCLISYLYCLNANAGAQLFSGSVSVSDMNQSASSTDSTRADSVGSLCSFMGSFFKQPPLSAKDQSVSFSSALSDLNAPDSSSLSSLVGYHDSPLNRTVSSVHSRSQLNKLLDRETCDSVIDPIDCSAYFNYDPSTGNRLYQPGTSQLLFAEEDTSLSGLKSYIEEQKPTVYSRRRPDKRIFQRKRSDSSPKVQTVTELSEILSVYGLEEEKLENYELKLRIWLCNTIVRPLVNKIEEINRELADKHPSLHLRIGASSLELLQNVLLHKQDVCSTSVPFLLPYLRFHSNQQYIVHRLQTLSRNIALEEFKWNWGGVQAVMAPAGDQEECSFNRFLSWNEQMPTDAELVWHLFCTYMDLHLTPSSDAVSGIAESIKPFSQVFFAKSGGKFPMAFGWDPLSKDTSGEMADKFFIRMASDRPPIFELVIDGGETVILPNRGGSHNFWLVLILFLAHVKKLARSRIGQLHISSLSLDIFEI